MYYKNFHQGVQKCTIFAVFAPIVKGAFFMQEKSTFVKLHRSITKWRWYKNQNTKALFIHLMIIANIKDQPFENITVKRGQVITSLASLSSQTGLTMNQVRTALQHLISTKEITSKTTTKYTIITIKNYDEYQKVTKEITNEPQTDNKQITNKPQQYKKEKNIKNVKNERECKTTPKNTFGEFNNVYLTETEVANLKQRYPKDYVNKIEKLSAYLESTGKEYNSHYAVLLQWLAEDLAKAQQSGGGKSYGNKAVNTLQQERSYDLEALENMDYYDEYLNNLVKSIG